MLAGLVTLAGVGGMFGCSQERALQPTPMSYRLYVSMISLRSGRDWHLLVLDCDTDSIVDSVYYNSWGAVYASPSSPVIVIPDGSVHKVYDPRSRAFVAAFPTQVGGAAFFPDLGRAAVSGANTLILEDTTYAVRAVIEREIWNCKRISRTSHMIGRSPYGPSGRYSSFTIADVLTGAIVDSFRINGVEGTSDFIFNDFDISPDGTRVYAWVGNADSAGVVGYDLRNRKVLFWYPHVGSSGPGTCYLSPRGDEVWVTWGATNFGPPWPISVHILDAFSGTLIDTVDLSPENLGWPGPTAPTQIRFVPNEPKAYVSCGTWFTGAEPVVVVNTESHEIEKILFANSGRIPQQIALGAAW